MTPGSLKRAASQNGVAPTSSGLKLKSCDERRVGVQVRSGAFGSAPWARSALTICSSRRMIAACSAVKPAAAAFGSAPLLEQKLDQLADNRSAPPAPWR